MDNGGPAFPNTIKVTDEDFAELRGMSLRDYFAAKCLPVLVQGYADYSVKYAKEVASTAYKFADAMLEERKVSNT